MIFYLLEQVTEIKKPARYEYYNYPVRLCCFTNKRLRAQYVAEHDKLSWCAPVSRNLRVWDRRDKQSVYVKDIH